MHIVKKSLARNILLQEIQWEQQFNASAYNRNEFSGNEALGTGGKYNFNAIAFLLLL